MQSKGSPLELSTKLHLSRDHARQLGMHAHKSLHRMRTKRLTQVPGMKKHSRNYCTELAAAAVFSYEKVQLICAANMSSIVYIGLPRNTVCTAAALSWHQNLGSLTLDHSSKYSAVNTSKGYAGKQNHLDPTHIVSYSKVMAIKNGKQALSRNHIRCSCFACHPQGSGMRTSLETAACVDAVNAAAAALQHTKPKPRGQSARGTTAYTHFL